MTHTKPAGIQKRFLLYFKKTPSYICTITIFLIITISFTPNAEARNVFRNIFRGIKNVSRFIVTLPDKTTRWMGPVLGPIAADIISQNLLVNKHVGDIFRHAHKINQNITNIEEQKKYMTQVQSNLRNQSAELKSQAQDIRNMKDKLEQELLSRDISYSDYKDKVVALENVASAYERTAERFDRTANNLKPDNLIRMVARNAWNQTLRQIRNEVKYSIKNELDRFVNPSIISALVGNDDKSLDQIIEILASGNIASVLGQKDSKIDADELKNRVRDRIKNILETNKDALKNNWRNEINKVIKEELEKLEKERKNLPVSDENKNEDSGETKESTPSTEETNETSDGDTPKGEGDCPPGYTPCPRCGITCIQKNCNEIENAHYSYESYCVCGSSGSIAENPKDPNKECGYSPAHKACPGCLYACVHNEEDCPLEGIGEY